MMPNMRTTLAGFEDTMQFQIVKKTIVDHELVESSKEIPVLYFEGVLQPLHDRELLVKSEGQRKFKWWTLFTDMENLAVDTVIQDPNKRTFRVMASGDWDDAGYFKYQLVEGVDLDQEDD